MKQQQLLTSIRSTIIGIILFFGMMPLVFADVYINVMAVNGADISKTTKVKQNLPGELGASDILDTNGLQLDYNVNDANFYVHGEVTLAPKESKTFKITVKDVWKVTQIQVEDIKKQIGEGFDRLGNANDQHKTDVLKAKLLSKLDYITDLQNNKSDGVERRIDSFRAYDKEVKRIKNDALSVEYWRSDPDAAQQKIMHMVFEVENPSTSPKKMVKYKNYLPSEVKSEHVVEAEGFEVRFDQQKQKAFLFKEEELESGQKKKYNIGILDIWFIDQKEIDYQRSRTTYAVDFLKNSKFATSSKFLKERIEAGLAAIETAQAQAGLPIAEHISAFRVNQKIFTDAKQDVETLEKLLATYRENLEKTKVDNVLKKVKSLDNVSKISDAIFKKKLEIDTAWKYIGWILLGAFFITLSGYVVSLLRSKDKKIAEGLPAKAEGSKAEAKV